MGRYSSPIQSLVDRLTYHTLAGQTPARMLDGLKFKPVPVFEVQGDTDLPNVRLFIPDVSEQFSPARNVDGSFSVKLELTTLRDSTDNNSIPEHMEWLETLLDALQTDTVTGLVTVLTGCARHFDTSVKDASVTDKSMTSPVILILHLKKNEIGRRR